MHIAGELAALLRTALNCNHVVHFHNSVSNCAVAQSNADITNLFYTLEIDHTNTWYRELYRIAPRSTYWFSTCTHLLRKPSPLPQLYATSLVRYQSCPLPRKQRDQ